MQRGIRSVADTSGMIRMKSARAASRSPRTFSKASRSTSASAARFIDRVSPPKRSRSCERLSALRASFTAKRAFSSASPIVCRKRAPCVRGQREAGLEEALRQRPAWGTDFFSGKQVFLPLYAFFGYCQSPE